jgi:hypothetical protein
MELDGLGVVFRVGDVLLDVGEEVSDTETSDLRCSGIGRVFTTVLRFAATIFRSRLANELGWVSRISSEVVSGIGAEVLIGVNLASFFMVLDGGGRGKSLLIPLPKNKELFLDPLDGG